MKINEKTGLRILTPDNPENWLTNGETYSQKVYLGSGASPDDWSEIPVAEYSAFIDIDPSEAITRLEALL